MTTDTTNISTETTANSALQEGDVEQGHLTQSNAPVAVQVPAGENIVRIQVTPGETIQLPFPTDGLVAKLSPDNANLAVKVGDVTVILLGYSEATAASEVTILGSNGQPVDVVTVLANTDPNLDITTAAGPGAGDQGTGADNNGGVFTPFDPNAGIGGLNAIGGLDPTALQYGLLQREFPELEENDDVDTSPTLINIHQGAVINEDDLRFAEEKAQKLAPDQDSNYQSQISGELADTLGISWAHTGGKQGQGNDEFDLDDHEEESDNGNDPANEANGNGVDIDREPLTSTATINIDFHQDVPGKISFQNGSDIPLQTQLEAMGLTSHGNPLQYVLLPAVADDPNTPGDESHGEVLVAYYVTGEGEGAYATIVFTVGVREQNGDNSTDFHIDFTIYGPIDNVPGIADADGDISDILDIDVPFFMVDSDGSVTPSPDHGLTFHSVDDVPHLGVLGVDGEYSLIINPTETGIVHDETRGVQSGVGQQAGDPDSAKETTAENDVSKQTQGVAEAVHAAGWDGQSLVGAAQTYLRVSFGADGKAGNWSYDGESYHYAGNKEAGKTVFTGDDDGTFATAFQLYVGDAAAPLTAGATNWTVMIDGVEVVVRAVQIDANTIVGFANLNDKNGDGQPDGGVEGGILVRQAEGAGDVPVFVLRLDPESGQLTLVQLHPVNQPDTTNADDATPALQIGGQDVNFRATDFDGDHVDAPLAVQIQDDGPTIHCDNAKVRLDDDALAGGNPGGIGDDPNSQNATGTLVHNYGKDGAGSLLLTGVTLPAGLGFTSEVTDGGKTLIISQDGVPVLKVALSDDTSGNYTVTQLAPVHHPAGDNENNVDFTVGYQVKDADGDSVNGTLAINVDDDTPKITGVKYDTPLLGIVDEDKLPGGIEGGPLDIGNFGASVGGKVLAAPGADQPVTFTFQETTGTGVNVAGAALPPVFALTDLAGNPVTLVVDNAGSPATLKGVAGGIDVFSISLNKATGEFTFTLLQPVKHPSNGAPLTDSLEDSLLTLGFTVKVTDADGDSDTASLFFKINDDSPKVEANDKVQLDDDALAGGNPGGTGDKDDSVHATGVLSHQYGADGAGSTLLTGATLPNGQGFTQVLSDDGKTLTISQNGVAVLQITLSDSTGGNYTVTQLAPINHPSGNNENGVDFTVKYEVKDADGDTVGGTLKINVNDDTPVLNPNASPITAIVEEDGMSLATGDKSEGNKDAGDSNSDDEASGIAGSLNGLYKGGADAPLTISMGNSVAGLPQLMSHGIAVSYSISNGVLTASAGGNTVFTLSVNSDGSWAFDLKDQLDHVAGNGENFALKTVGGGSVNAIDFSSLIVATDNDGDKAPTLPGGSFAIQIQDDVPVANDDHQFMKESEHTITGNVLTGDTKDPDTLTDQPSQADHVGADEPGRITQVHSINTNGAAVNVDNGDNGVDGDTVVVQGQYGKLTINEDGTYSYTLDPAFDINTLTATPVHLGRSGTGATASEWVAQGFSMKATKFDGSNGTITYDANGIGVSGTKPGLQVPGQIGYDPNSQTSEKITMAFDCPVNSITMKVSNLYRTENDGEQGTWKAYDANGNVIGQGLFGPGPDNAATGYIHVNYGTSDNVGTLTIDVGDTKMEGIAKIEFGATEYGPGSNSNNPTTDSSDYYIREVTYVPAVVQEKFQYTLTDSDGDNANAVLTIDVCDNVPSPRAGNAAGLVTEDTLAGGSGLDPASAPASHIFTGTLPIFNGKVSNLTFDDPASSLEGPAPTKTEDANSITLTQAGEWTITINKTTGAFTFTLLDDQAHGDAAKLYGNDTLIGKFIATVSGSGGADATGAITITVNDDGPTAKVNVGSDAGVILETQDKDTKGDAFDTATTSANFGGVFSFLKSGGADGEASSSLTFKLNVNADNSGLTSGGAVVHLYNIGGVVVGSTAANDGSVSLANTIFTVEVNASGEVKLTQYQQIDHGNSESVPAYDDDVRTLADGKISLTATGTITDGDGDKATDSATVDLGGNIRFDDDGPTAKLSEGSLSIRLDESIGYDFYDPNATNDDAASVGFIGKQTGSVTGLFGTPDYGADGKGAEPSYHLVLTGVGGVETSFGTTNVATNLSVVDTNNAYPTDHIVLVAVSENTINGYVGSYDPANAGSAVLAFTVQIDPATGVVTVEQKLPIAHDMDGGSAASHDDLASLIVSGGGIFASQTVTDGDGDKSTVVAPAQINVGFEDDGPKFLLSPIAATVDEDGLANGIVGGPDDTAVDSAATSFYLSVDFGSDGPGAEPLKINGVTPTDANGQPINVTSGGVAVEYVILTNDVIPGYPAGTLVGYAGATPHPDNWVFTVTLNAQGAGTFTLLKPIDHPVAGLEDNIHFVIGVTATDGDGDFTYGAVRVTVNDDSPVAVDDGTLKITGIGGAVAGVNLLANDNVGADQGGQIVGVRLGGETGAYTAVGAGGTDISIKADGTEGTPAVGTLHVNQDGSWTFTQTASSDLPNLTFSYKMKDRDGDTDTASFHVDLNSVPTITVTPTSPSTTAGQALVDEDYLPAGDHDVHPSTGDDAGGASATGTWSTSNGDPTVTVTVDGITSGVSATGATALNGSPILWFTDSTGLPTVLHGKTSANGADYFTLTINANGTWQFDLLQPVQHSGVGSEDPNVVLNGVTLKATDADGDAATAQIKIAIDDDMPVAHDDADSVGNVLTTDGNVITGLGTTGGLNGAGADAKGGDGASVSAATGYNGSSDNDASNGLVVNGQYGKLTLQANGDYTYERFNGTPLDAVDHFTYTLKDGDGDTSTAKLDITISDKAITVSVPPAGSAGALVDEKGLPTGTGELANPAPDTDNSEKTSGKITITAPDGLAEVTIGGTTLTIAQLTNAATFPVSIATAGHVGSLVITGYDPATKQISYTYTLTTNTNGEGTHDDFAISVKDSDGDTGSTTLVINIKDDAPIANDDNGGAVNSGATATGQVLTNDVIGADGPATTIPAGGVVGVKFGNDDNATSTGVDATIQGTFGKLVLHADGTYSYVAKTNAELNGASGTDTFSYTIKDSDGDTAVAQLTFNVSPITITVTPADNTVDEAALDQGTTGSDLGHGTVVGSQPGLTSETVTGTLTLPAGVHTVAQEISTPLGMFKIDTDGNYTYTLIKNSLDHTSDLPNTDPNATNPDAVQETINVSVIDGQGNTGSTSITIHVKDDVPTAYDDSNWVKEDSAPNPISGNVLTNDVGGADGLGSVLTAGTFTLAYGTLVIHADGSYSYTLNNANAAVNALAPGQTLTDSFTYKMNDKDGDTSSAKLTITIKGTNDLPEVKDAAASVSEEGLTNGIADTDGTPDTTNSPTFSGNIAISDVDAGQTQTVTLSTAASLTSGGVAIVWSGQDTGQLIGKAGVNGAEIIRITISNTGAYTVTLSGPVDHADTTIEDGKVFGVTVTSNDGAGGVGTGTLTVTVEDDSPKAVNDGTVNAQLGSTVNALSSLLDNDFGGADGKGSVIGVKIGTDAGTSFTSVPAGGADLYIKADGTAGDVNNYAAKVHVNPDGSWSVTQTTSSTVANVTLSYQMNDRDGDTSSATFKAALVTQPAPNFTSRDEWVDEDGLPAGLNNNVTTAQGNGDNVGGGGTNSAGTSSSEALRLASFNLGGQNITALKFNVADITLGHFSAIKNPAGVAVDELVYSNNNMTLVLKAGGVELVKIELLTLNGDYRITLLNEVQHPNQGEDDVGGAIKVLATNGGGTTEATINLKIDDDAPVANPDTNSVKENATPNFVTGNVLTNDLGGADGKDVVTQVGGVAGNVGQTITTTYGTILIKADGSYTYTVDNNNPAVDALNNGQHLTDTITYQMRDKDGDTSTTTLSIRIDGTTDSFTVHDSAASVSEEGLGNGIPDTTGTPDTTNSPTFSGNITFNDPNPGQSPVVTLSTTASLTSGGVAIVWSGQDTGTLIGKAGVNGAEVIKIVIGNNGAYTVTLSGPVDHANPAIEDGKAFDVAVKVIDGLGAGGNATLTITVEDDSPSAVADTNSTTEGSTLTVDAANGVLKNDAPGADGYAAGGSVVGVRLAGADTTSPVTTGVNTVINGQYGTLTLQADGSYVYKSNPNSISANVVDTFVYTIKDKDGDVSTTTLKINVADSSLVVNPVEATVDEAALDTTKTGSDLGFGTVTGSNPNSTAETVTGSLTLPVGVTVTPQTNVATPLGLFSIDANGNYTYTLTKNSLGHTTVNSTNADAVVDTITVTVKDGNNNAGSTTITIHVKDDVPNVTVGGSEGVATVDESNLAINGTADFSGNFIGSLGADGGTAAYTLSVVSGPSGLVDTATNQAVSLFMNNGVVEGRIPGGTVVFTVSVNSAGVVTLDQIRAVVHSNTGDPDDSTTLSADNLVKLTKTLTDGDGDTASATLNIGQNLVFKDDGPTIVVSVAPDTMTVDETNLNVNATANFADNFTINAGADGQASVTYALSATLGASGLIDTASGQVVNLVMNNGVVEGRTATGDQLVFSVSVDSSGNVTLDQVRAVVHSNTSNPDDSTTLSQANLVKLTATVTDKDGDSKAATINLGQSLVFKDDGPAASAKAGVTLSATLDESDGNGSGSDGINPALISAANVQGMFNTPVYGADGSGSTTYALTATDGAKTGLWLAGKSGAGNEIVLVKISDTKYEGHETNASGTKAFTVEIDATTGAITVTQNAALNHPTGSAAHDDSVSLAATAAISVVQTVADKDGDKATATSANALTIAFEDDGPIAVADTASVKEDTAPNPITGNVLSNDKGGADGVGAVTQVNGSAGSVGATINTTYGSIKLNADGSYSYTLDNTKSAVQALAPGQTLSDVVTYQMKDKDGDTSSTTLTITINGTNDNPTVGNATATVSEEGLPNANFDNTGDPDTTNSKTASGTITVADVDAGQTQTVTLSTSASLTSGGQAITWSGQNSGTLTGSVGGTEIIKIVIGNNGAYTVTLSGPIDHPDATKEDAKSFNVTVTSNDGAGGTGTGTLTVTVEDDSPTIFNNNQVWSLKLDESKGAGNPTAGSGTDGINSAILNGDSLRGGLSAKAGADGLASQVYSLTATDGAKTGLWLVGKSGAANEIVLVKISDTKYEGHEGNAAGTKAFTIEIDPATAQVTVTRNANLNHPSGGAAHDDAVTLGASIQVTLTAIDKDGDKATASLPALAITFEDDGPRVVADAFGAFGAVGVASGATVTLGNLLDNDFSGTDGYQAKPISAVTTTAGNGTVTGSEAAGFDITIAGKGVAHIDTATGAVTFTAAANTSLSTAGETFTFSYTVKDLDGDTATTTATYTVKNPNYIVVGENVNDTDSQSTNHRVDNSPSAPNGAVDGGSGTDVLIGDVGGKTSTTTPGKNYSIALICDMSYSMDHNGGNGDPSVDRVALLKSAVTSFVNSLIGFNGTINLGLIAFGTTATIELTVNNLTNANKQSMINEIATLASSMNGDYTNYEAAFNSTKSWFDSQSGSYSSYEKLAFFMTDGDPTTYVGAPSTTQSIDDLDMQKGYNAYKALLTAYSTLSVNAIGIGNDLETTRLRFFDNTTVTGTANYGSGSTTDNIVNGNVGQPQLINTAGELTAVLTGGSTSTTVAPVGNDTINGGDGNDAILGDSIYFGSADAGWAAYVADASHSGWTAEQMRADIFTNLTTGNHSYAGEGTVGGNDTINAGAGNDYVYGQGGNDILHGDADNDFLFGGSGNDQLFGDDGNDYLDGGAGNDTLDGGTGTNQLFGGDGDDRLYFDTAAGSKFDGGNHTGGNDFSGSANTIKGDILDLSHISGGSTAANAVTVDIHTGIANGNISHIETIDMTGGGTQKVFLSAADVIGIGDATFDPASANNTINNFAAKDAVKVDGTVGDVVRFSDSGWTAISLSDLTNEPSGYKVYVHDGSNANGIQPDAYVLVHPNVTVQDMNGNTI